MKILGVDYGQKKVGLAIGENKLAEPLEVIRFNNLNELIKKIDLLIKKEEIDKLVIGVSEGKMGEETKRFAHILGNSLDIPIEIWDETLSTNEAIKRSIEANIKKAKRKKMEDAYAATIMLQDYLDSTIG